MGTSTEKVNCILLAKFIFLSIKRREKSAFSSKRKIIISGISLTYKLALPSVSFHSTIH